MGANGILSNSNFTGNIAINYNSAGVLWEGANGTLSNSIFINNVANENAGGVYWIGANGTLIDSTFTGNTATKYYGGAVLWEGTNSKMINCNFTNNHAKFGNNVFWKWTVEEFLNKYTQINDYDYVYIKNGVGTPKSTIILNKKGITLSSEGNVIFDGKGKNLHFEITGNNVIIEQLTFRNFNLTN